MQTPWDLEAEFFSNFNEKMELKFANSLNRLMALMDDQVIEKINNFFPQTFLLGYSKYSLDFFKHIKFYLAAHIDSQYTGGTS